MASIRNLFGHGKVTLRGETVDIYRFYCDSFKGLTLVVKYFEDYPLKTKKSSSSANLDLLFEDIEALLTKGAITNIMQDRWFKNFEQATINIILKNTYNLKVTDNKRELVYLNGKFVDTKPLVLNIDILQTAITTYNPNLYALIPYTPKAKLTTWWDYNVRHAIWWIRYTSNEPHPRQRR